MSDAGGAAAGGEDRKSEDAFREIENHCGEAGDWAERHADEDNSEVL
jgi:hypothetical protein